MKLLISVDRLDYVNGIPLRMDAMETLLTHHPELIGKIALLQILIPNREDVEGYQLASLPRYPNSPVYIVWKKQIRGGRRRGSAHEDEQQQTNPNPVGDHRAHLSL
jgi:hypothetical protein